MRWSNIFWCNIWLGLSKVGSFPSCRGEALLGNLYKIIVGIRAC